MGEYAAHGRVLPGLTGTGKSPRANCKPAKVVLHNQWVPIDVLVVAERAVKDAALPLLADPGNGKVSVRANNASLFHVRLAALTEVQPKQVVARGGIVILQLINLVGDVKRRTAGLERGIQWMIDVAHLHRDGVAGPPRMLVERAADHVEVPGVIPQRVGGRMDSGQTAAVFHKIVQRLHQAVGAGVIGLDELVLGGVVLPLTVVLAEDRAGRVEHQRRRRIP